MKKMYIAPVLEIDETEVEQIISESLVVSFDSEEVGDQALAPEDNIWIE